MKDRTVSTDDTTLKMDVAQEHLFICEDKLRIARKLDDLGFAYIEGGWPGSNPKDVEFFEKARNVSSGKMRKSPRLAPPAGQMPYRRIRQYQGAAGCRKRQSARVVGKSSTLHVRDVLKTTLEDNLRIIEVSLAYLRGQNREVIYDAEHFFDGFKADPDYALATLKAAQRGGAQILVLCDTNGGSMPWEITDLIAAVQKNGCCRWASMSTMTANAPSLTLSQRCGRAVCRCRAPSTATGKGAGMPTCARSYRISS